MKKGFWKMLATGIAAAVVGGCVEHDEGADASREIGFDIAAAESRAIIEEAGDMETFDVWGWYTSTRGASIDVFGTPNASEGYTGVKVENTGGAWRYEGERYWVADVFYDFFAAHPSGLGATCTNEGALAVKNFNASRMGENAVDLMTASATNRIYTAGGNNQVGFTFHHELARVQVVVNAGQGVKVKVLGAKVYGVSTSGDFARELGTSTATGTWTSLATAVTEGDTPYRFSGNTELDGDGATNQATVLDLAVIPQGITDARLVLTYQREGDKQQRTTEPLRLDQNSTTWSAGNAYRYTLNVEVDAITFSGFTVDEWGYSYSGGDINIGGTTNNGN